MTNKDVILKSIAFIERNLKNEINVFMVSKEVCYSLYHFIRLFQNITGYSPKSYIQQRRLSEAAFELRDASTKISDIAYNYQFGSPESFSRAFRKQFHVNPTDIRKGYSLHTLPLVPSLTRDSIYQSDKLRDQSPEVLQSDERILIGNSFFIGETTEINDLSKEWQRFLNEKHTIRHIIKPERYYQVQYWSENQDLGGMYFFTGVEVSQIEGINPVFDIKIIPRGTYLRFIHKGLSNKVGYTYRYIYNQFLPDTDYKLTIPFNFEFYGKSYLGPYNEKSESDIFIPVE